MLMLEYLKLPLKRILKHIGAFINKGACFTTRATTMIKAYVLNPKGLHYSMTWT